MAHQPIPAGMVWSNMRVKGFVPSGRHGHTSNVVDRFVYVHGGMQGGVRVNTTMAFDVDTATWSRVNTRGTPPTARTEHVSWTLGKHLYVQGGESGGGSPDGVGGASSTTRSAGGAGGDAGQGGGADVASSTAALLADDAHRRVLLDDLFQLDTETFTWTQVHTRLAPLPRKGHSATVLETVVAAEGVGPTVVLFGGVAAGLGEPLNEVVTLDLGALGSWRSMWMKVELSGTPPRARYGHSATAITDHSLLVFGGATSGTTFLNDLHLLDLREKSWQRVSARGLPPTPRRGHQTVLVPGRPPRRPPMLVIFGGVSVANSELQFPRDLFTFDVVHRQWSEVRVGYLFPAPRCGHTLVVVPPKEGGESGKPALRFGGPGAARGMLPRSSVVSASAPMLSHPGRHKWPQQTPIGSTTPIAAHGAATATAPMGGQVGVGNPDGHLGGVSMDSWDGMVPDYIPRPKVPDVWLAMFGGVNVKYCPSEVWKLRIRRRASWMYKHAGEDGGSKGKEPEESSGSDSPASGDDEAMRAAGSLIEEYGSDPAADGPASGDSGGPAGSNDDGERAKVLEGAVIAAKKERLKMEDTMRKETEARKKAESERDELKALLKAATSQLTSQKRQHESTLVKLKRECDVRVEEAESKARQARADLNRVVHILCLHDLASNLRLEVMKRRAASAARPSSTLLGGTSHSVLSEDDRRTARGGAGRPLSAMSSDQHASDDFGDDDDEESVHEGQL